MRTKNLSYRPNEKNIAALVDLYKEGRLILNPDFQRNSVWKKSNRQKLIESILRKYPLPAVFLYEREKDGKPIYDVIDGKQRIETIFMFMGVIPRKRFSVKGEFDSSKDGEEVGETKQEINWSNLGKKGEQASFNAYKVNTIEVDGDISDIMNLFVKINSTGMPLTSAEKRKAKNLNSPFLKSATSIAKLNEKYFIDNRIFSVGQISRMKDIELICEIMLSIHNEGVINRKIALDNIMSKGLTNTEISKLNEKVKQTFKYIKKMFPEIKSTRFNKLSDFYVLAVLISKYIFIEKIILDDPERNKLAFKLLVEFDKGVIRVRDNQNKVQGIAETDNTYRDYHLTVKSSTDEISQRRKRMDILDRVLRSIFDKKDSKRVFSRDQRRLIWHSDEEKICTNCDESLTWSNFTIDHIKPYSKGGTRDIKNAAIMCRKCNSSKGNR